MLKLSVRREDARTVFLTERWDPNVLYELGGGLASYYTDPYDYTDSIVNQDNIEKVSDDVVYFNEDNSKTVIDVKYKERFKEEIKMFVISTLVSLGFAYSISKDKVKMKKMWEE